MRFAHCSDLHLLSLEGTRWLDFANKRWIGGLNLLSNRGRHYHPEVFEAMVEDFNRGEVDHVICTGDVTNLALEGEFAFARTHFDAITLGPQEVTVLPGNHDAYVARGADHFREAFSDYYEPDPEWIWDDGEKDVWPVVRVRGPVAIIALSTSLHTPWFTAYGRIGDCQIGRLRQALSDPRLRDKLRVVAIHHPPAGPPARSRVRGLRDRDALARVLADTGAELVIHGHEHRDMHHELHGPGGAPIPVRGIQSGTYEADRPERRARYRIFEVGEAGSGASGGHRVEYRQRVWDPEGRSFIDDVPAVTGEVASPAPALR